jgi:NAD(P)-dependent dehydrogenase (short-subunit alcohol dehydrogenase family)
MPNIVLVGAGRGLGFSLARTFGARGWKVALVARRKTELTRLCSELRKGGVDATPYQCDVAEDEQVVKVFDYIKTDLKDQIDALYYGPALARGLVKYDAEATTVKAVSEPWRTLVDGAVSVVRAVLPGMLEKKKGALVFTTCASSVRPTPQYTPASIAMAGLRSYALCLNAELTPKGVYAAHVSIGVEIKAGTEGDPDRLAQGFAALIEGRQLPEAVISPQAGGAPAPAPPSKD